jgi:Bacterial type II/III secretion system short domain
MKTAKRILLGLALAGLLGAQTAAPEENAKPAPHLEKRVFQVKYADVRALRNVLNVFGYGITADTELHVLAVSAPSDVMSAIEDAIKRLDVPTAAPKDIDLVVYLVVASEQAVAGDGLPPELQPVVRQLKGVFSFRSYRVLDTLALRTRPGNKANAEGIINTGDAQTLYHFSVRPTAVTEDPQGRVIRLDDLALGLRVPTRSGLQDAGINTEITVREGQKVVVGKSNMGAPGQALILVVTAKVAE